MAGARGAHGAGEAQRLYMEEVPMDLDAGGLKEKRSERIPSYGFVILLGSLFLLAYLTSLIDDAMPRVITEDEANYTDFSEERAWKYLRDVVGTGPRVAGSAYHLEKTRDLKTLVDQIASGSSQTVHTDWQVVTGDYWLSYRLPYVNSYARAPNIIALLEGESGFNANGTTNSSILLNCHYDSVPTSPGASDNAIFCAVLLETLLLLSRRQHKLKHNVIFLFNGAEENSLQASHAFLRHQWAHGVTGLVNLDAAGMNGKSILFQVTDPRVLAAYRTSVPSPNAQAVGEALFSSGLVPSDTDFRVFRDFGQIHGVDIAFTRYGHVYHTRYDALALIKPGVIQHAGNVIYHLAGAMANMDEFRTKETNPSTAVYWDYMNLFMASYSFTTANVVDSIVMLFAMSSVAYYLYIVGFTRRQLTEFIFQVISRLIAVISGTLIVAILTTIMIASMPQLRYYSNAWIVVPMFWVPFLLGAVLASQAFDWWRSSKSGLNRTRRTAQAMAATRLLWALTLLFLLFIPVSVTMRYVITLPLLLTSTVSFASLTVLKLRRITAWQQLVMECVLSLPALMFVFGITFKLDALMLPIMGRSLTMTPDRTVAILNVAMAVLCCMPLAGVELLFSRRRVWIVASALGALSIVLMFLPLRVYYGDSATPAPQRYNVFHTTRATYDFSGGLVSSSSGIWAGHTDVNSPGTLLRAANLTGLNVQTDFSEDCARKLYCDLPMVTPRTKDFVRFSAWIEFPPPAPFTPEPGLQLANRTCQDNNCTLHFTMTGSPHTSLAIWLRAGVNVTAWSFHSEPLPVSEREERPVFFIYHTECTYAETQVPLEWSLQLSTTDNVNGLTEPLVDISFNTHKTHHENELTAQFSQFVAQLPDWLNVVPYITSRINYVF